MAFLKLAMKPKKHLSSTKITHEFLSKVESQRNKIVSGLLLLFFLVFLVL